MDKDGPETMREAVARAIARELTGGVPSGPKSIDHKAADAAIRTVLERLREPSEVQIEAGKDVEFGVRPVRRIGRGAARSCWQAMLDAAAREVG